MKRFLSIMLIFVLIVTAMPLQVWAEEVLRPTGRSFPEPIITVTDMDMPSIDPGKSKNVSLTIQSMGNHALDVMVNPRFTEPISSNNFSSSISIGDINQNAKKYLDLNIAVAENAAPGNYPVVLDFSYYYNDGDGNKVPVSGKEVTIYVRVSGKTSASKLLISKISTEPEVILPNQDVKLNLLFENMGSLDANNVNIRLEGLDSAAGFFIGSGTDVKYLNRVPGNMVSSVSFDLKASPKITRGTHELEVVFKYGEIEERQKLYLIVGGSNVNESNLLIENLEYPTTGISPNKDFTLKFNLRNNGDTDAVNILVKAESTDPAVVPKSTSILKVNSLKAEETKDLSFVFTPTEDAITRNYPINITVEYEDEFNQGDDSKHTINQYVGMYVVAKDSDDTKGKPKLIIDKYSFEPQLVAAGENFEMSLSFYNTNSTKSVNNIKIFLTAEPGSTSNEGTATDSGSAFTPVDSSNTFYIDSIPPKGRVEKTITMFVVPDAIAKTHTITANFEYEDNEGNELKDIELIGVPVVQQSKLDLGELAYVPEAYMGQSTPISLEFYNTGKVTLYNMMVKLEGDFQTENAQYYVGNFDSGSSEYFEGYVIPNEMGDLTGDIVFTYEDSTGQVQEVRKEFSLNVMEMPDFEDPWGGEMPPMEEEAGLLKSKGLWITLGVIAAAIGGFVFYKKKKKDKELALDE
ncbi:MAG: hypothetical protein GX053_06540 [Tissierella sp.]|nr:hypothetical protein [Tissierella sp.]